MSDFARLEEKLAKLRERERAPGETRKLRGNGAVALIAAIVTEIDETILPRRLSFRIDGKQDLHLSVANRRLQAALSPLPVGNETGDLADRALADETDPGVAALKKVLETLCDAADSVEVVTARQSGAGFSSDVGVPARMLARAWNVEDVQSTEDDPKAMVTGFVAGLGKDAEAWLLIEGEDVIDQGGDPTRLTSLGEEAAVFLDSYFGKFDSLFGPDAAACCTVIAPSDPGVTAALFIEYGESSAFVAAPSGSVAGLAMRWQSLVAK